MGILIFIGVVYLIYKLAAEAVEDNRPSGGMIDNKKMFYDSAVKGTSSRDLKKNYKNGKYFK